MAEQRHNPDELSDEDWAMSEPEIPVKKDFQADQEADAAASLYDPLDTGDLEGWDISSADTSLRTLESGPEDVENPPNHAIAEGHTGEAEIPVVFDIPRHAFEVLRPVPPPNAAAEDWGVDSSKSPGNEGWKMPEPVFRVSGGRTVKGPGHPAGFADEPVAENLVDIYEPPDSRETSGAEAAEFGGEDPEAAGFGNVDPEPETGGQFELSGETATAPAQVTSRSGKKWIFIGLGILVFGLVAGLITIAAFGVVYFRAK